MLLSDRFLSGKLAASLALFGLLLLWGGFRSEAVSPSFRDCRADPERHRGREVYVGVAKVMGSLPGMVKERENKEPIHVLQDLPGVSPGELVSIRGEFVPPDGIRPGQWTRHPGYVWKRVSMYVVSAGALLLLLALVARRYRIVTALPMFIRRD